VGNAHLPFKGLVVALAYLGSAVTARPDLMITNASGVRAGITGIVSRPPNGIGVDFAVVDPTGTNVTKFTFQRSFDMKTWADYTGTNVVTGSSSGESSDLRTSANQFYRMRLINFR